MSAAPRGGGADGEQADPAADAVHQGFLAVRHNLVLLRREAAARDRPATPGGGDAAAAGGEGRGAAGAVTELVRAVEGRIGRLEVHVASERLAARRRAADLVCRPASPPPAPTAPGEPRFSSTKYSVCR